MRMRRFLIPLLLSLCTLGLVAAQNQQPSDNGRKILRKTVPLYPEIAKKMGLSGTVRVVAVVAPDGTVKSVEPVGGSPVLIEASKQAILQWKYAPAPAETKEDVSLHFQPQNQ